MPSLGLLSLQINITYKTWIPKELQKYIGNIKYLRKNIADSEARDGIYMPYPLNKDNHYHIEATDTLDFDKHMSNTSFYVNLIQHLDTDIPGNYYLIYLGNETLKSHFLASMLKTLYFYCYLLELKENEIKIIKNDSLKDSLNSLNSFMQNIQTYTQTFIIKNNEINKK